VVEWLRSLISDQKPNTIDVSVYNDTHFEGQGFESITYVTGQFVMTVLIVLPPLTLVVMIYLYKSLKVTIKNELTYSERKTVIAW